VSSRCGSYACSVKVQNTSKGMDERIRERERFLGRCIGRGDKWASGFFRRGAGGKACPEKKEIKCGGRSFEKKKNSHVESPPYKTDSQYQPPGRGSLWPDQCTPLGPIGHYPKGRGGVGGRPVSKNRR